MKYFLVMVSPVLAASKVLQGHFHPRRAAVEQYPHRLEAMTGHSVQAWWEEVAAAGGAQSIVYVDSWIDLIDQPMKNPPRWTIHSANKLLDGLPASI
jgi:hypothetical protein